MAQKDFMGTRRIGAEDIVFDSKELFKDMFSWLNEHGYDYEEVDHEEAMLDEGVKRISMEFGAVKKANEYVKQHIDISVSMKIKDVEVKDKKKQKGSIKLEFEAYLKKDYAGEWDAPFARFVREVYDKFVYRGKLAELGSDLTGDLDKLIIELKAFLKLTKRVM